MVLGNVIVGDIGYVNDDVHEKPVRTTLNAGVSIKFVFWIFFNSFLVTYMKY